MRFRRNLSFFISGYWLWVICGMIQGATVLGSRAADFTYRAWHTDAGLPEESVTSIVQGSEGYLWVATESGVARFDGVRFVAVSPPDRSPAKGERVNILCPRRQGGVWGASSYGWLDLWRDGKTFASVKPPDVSNAVPTSVCEDSNGVVFVGLSKAGVLCYADGKAISFDQRHGLSIRRLPTFVASDRDGNVWCATGNKVTRFINGSFVKVATLGSDATAITAAQSGGVWVGSGNRLRRFSPETSNQAEVAVGLRSSEVTAIHENRRGEVWIGTDHNGLFRLEGGVAVPFEISDPHVAEITSDREQNIWVATKGGGVVMIQPQLVREIRFDGPRQTRWLSLTEDSTGAIWVVDDRRELHRMKGVWEQIPVPFPALCVAAMPDGSVMIGTYDGGLYRWRDATISKVGAATEFGAARIDGLLVTRRGDLWVMAMQQLTRVRGEELKRWSLPTSATPRGIVEGPQGEVFVGTVERQLLRFIDDSMEKIKLPDLGPSAGLIFNLACGSNGSIWIGFANAGLGRWKDGQFNCATDSDGLPNDMISQLLVDDHDRVWLGSNKGLSRVNPQDFDAYAANPGSGLRVVSYWKYEANFSAHTTQRNRPNTLRTASGELWFTTSRGAIVVAPNARSPNQLPPPAILESLSVDHREVSITPTPTLRLPPNHNRLDFQFTALSFTAPENVEFKYRLEGADPNWINAGTARQAAYSRLPAGRYCFRVTASNNEGVWNEAGAAFVFSVAPFFWQTPWFLSATLITTLGIGVILSRKVANVRLKRRLRELEWEQRLSRERARIARDIHDDVGASLTEIALLGDLSKGERATLPEKEVNISKIAANARALLQTLGRLVWAVNPRNDLLPAVALYLGGQAGDFLRAAGIECDLQIPDELPGRTVDSATRHNLLLAMREALANVAKHAQASRVQLRLELSDLRLRLLIQDNGKGFETASANGKGHGLANMRERLSDIRGIFVCESVPGRGTKIVFDIPLTEVSSKFCVPFL